MTIANATTLAMQPHGAIAGSVAAALGFVQTFVPALMGSAVAAVYDGTALPMLGAMAAHLLAGLLLLPRPPRAA